mgnify:CR=1 FL=1
MLRFYAASFATALSALQASITVIILAPDYPKAVPDFKEAIRDIGTHLKDVPLSSVIRGQYARLAARAEAFDGRDWQTMQALAIEFGQSLETELTSHWFQIGRASCRERV